MYVLVTILDILDAIRTLHFMADFAISSGRTLSAAQLACTRILDLDGRAYRHERRNRTHRRSIGYFRRATLTARVLNCIMLRDEGGESALTAITTGFALFLCLLSRLLGLLVVLS